MGLLCHKFLARYPKYPNPAVNNDICLDEVAEEQAAVTVGKVNVDDEPELARQYRIMSIPTLIVFRDGEPVRREVGGRSKEEILEMVR